jgi:hypothetical protein
MNKKNNSTVSDVNMIKRPKCERVNGFCDTLFDRLHEANYRGKGFSPYTVIYREDLSKENFEPKVLGVRYRMNAGDQGIMLNYCPFCGSKLDWFRDKEKI